MPSDRKKQTFREFGKLAVLSTFSTKNGAVTKTGDIGKTFSRMENLAVLQGFSTQKRKPMFLTTHGLLDGADGAPRKVGVTPGHLLLDVP